MPSLSGKNVFSQPNPLTKLVLTGRWKGLESRFVFRLDSSPNSLTPRIYTDLKKTELLLIVLMRPNLTNYYSLIWEGFESDTVRLALMWEVEDDHFA